MALKFPDRLESNNPAAYGVVKANQVSGHKTVDTVENLYTLADAILSDNGTGNDAIGQRWYVISENYYYELVNWANRKTSTGWVKIYTDSDIQTKLDTKVDKVPGKSLIENTEINKLKELPNKSTLDSQIADAKQSGTSAQNNLTAHINNTENPHNVTKEQLKLENVTNDAQVKRIEMGVAGGVATLGGDGKVPSAQLPSFVDDVIEADSQTAFPKTGEVGKIYVALDTNLTYRWSGSGYVEISQSLALGETSSTAYAGDKGKKLADDFNAHKINTENPHDVTKIQVGLGNVDNTSDINKPISTATQEALNAKMNIMAQKLVDEDLDVILNYGFYYGGGDNTVVHKPAGVDAFNLHVYQTASGFKAQELTEGNINPGAVYWRQHNSLQWSPWIPKAGVFLSNPVNNQVLVSDTTGRLKSSGYTIASSVPTNAKFTDTIYDDTTIKQDITNLKTNKLDSSTYTAQDVLNKLKTVDGAGSGLEADIIDWSRIQNKPNIGWAIIE